MEGSVVHVVWSNNSGVIYCRSLNNGETWAPLKLISNLGLPSPWISASAIAVNSTNLHVVWDELNLTTITWEVYYANSMDGGATWSSTRMISELNASDSLNADIAASGSNVYIVWEDWRGLDPEVYYANSSDNGLTWSINKNLTINDGWTSAPPEIATNGSQIYVVWTENKNAAVREVYYRSSNDGGQTWNAERNITEIDGFHSEAPSIDIWGANIHVAWWDWRFGNTEIMYMASMDNGVSWSAPILLSGDDAFSSDAPTIASWGNDIDVVWSDTKDGYPFTGARELYYANSTDGGAAWSSPLRLTTAKNHSSEPAIATDGIYTYVVWSDNRSTGGATREVYYKRSPDFAPDATPPNITYVVPPTPMDGGSRLVSQNATIRVHYSDNESACTNATLFWKNSTETAWHWQLMANISFWNGSYNNYFEANFTEATPTMVTYYVNCTNSANLTTMAPPRTVFFADEVAPTNPLNVGGFVHLYNGNLATGYNPGFVEAATVTATTWNGTTYRTLTDVTDPTGFYQVTFTNGSYLDGGAVWVNTTTPANPTTVHVGAATYTFNAPGWVNNSAIAAVDSAGQLFCNETLGIPYNLTVRWVPDWTVTPIPGINILNILQQFYVTAVVRDRQGLLAPGYYGALRTWTNQTNGNLWGAPLPAQATATLDGLGGLASPWGDANYQGLDGFYNRSAAFVNSGIFVIWVNDTTSPSDSLTPDAPPPLPPQVSAVYERDNTHVRIIGVGGFFWRLLAGWNIVSVPQNTSAYYGPTFTASEAGSCVQAAAARYGVVLTTCLLAGRLAGSPASYQTWDVLAGAGVDFAMDIDHAYWLYVSAAITDVYVPSTGLLNIPGVGDPAMGIGPTGINQVSLAAGWNMVNSGLNETGTVFGLGVNAPMHIDVSGNIGNWASGTVLYTAGSFGAGYYCWFDAPLTGGHRNDAQGAGAGAGYASATNQLRCANTWDPATQAFNTGVAYADWVGQWNFGSAYNNQGSPVYYASGFWVYAETAGLLTYDISS
jgi:hypothetical protein